MTAQSALQLPGSAHWRTSHMGLDSWFFNASAMTGVNRALPGVSTCKYEAKARALLTERGVASLAAQILDPESCAEWFRHAIELQAAIYRLDEYYEASRMIARRAEEPFWSAVEKRLIEAPRTACGLWAAFEDLRNYANAERRIHSFDIIDPREFEGIVELKCSDVRMARELAWGLSQPRISKREAMFWGVYDQCWEIVEDLIDVQEDGRDWNFNFWLYGAMSGGSSVKNIESVQGLLWRKLGSLEELRRKLPTAAAHRCEPAWRATRSAANQLGNPLFRIGVMLASRTVWRFGES